MILVQPSVNEYDRFLSLADRHNIGFELTSFMFPAVLDDKKTVKRLLDRFFHAPVKAIHGPFVDLNYSGGDIEIFKVSAKRITRCAEIASKLGVKKMVLHSCFFPVLKKEDPLYNLWTEESAYLLDFISKTYGTVFCIENMLDRDPDIICRMASYNQTPTRRACLDAGHANLTLTPQENWVSALSSHLSHIHLSDNRGVYDEHLALGDGTVDWKGFFKSCEKHPFSADYTLEVGSVENIEKSVEYLKNLAVFERLNHEQ